MVEGRIETVVAAYWVTNSVEHCRVGFLPRFMVVQHADSLNGLMAQVTEVFDKHHPSAAIQEKVCQNFGFCHATILDPEQCAIYLVCWIVEYHAARLELVDKFGTI